MTNNDPLGETNPYSATGMAGNHPASSGPCRPARSYLPWLLVGGAVVIGIGLLLPMVRNPGPAVYRMSCGNNLKQIALALHIYEQVHGSFPPAFTVDADGKRLHSWRTLILPYLEYQALYDSIDLDAAWDDPVNQTAYEASVPVFQCAAAQIPANCTNYLGAVGEDAFWHPTRARTLSEIKAESKYSIMIAEVPAALAVHWMCPTDSDERTFMAITRDYGLGQHSSGYQVARADGSVTFLHHDTDLRHAEVCSESRRTSSPLRSKPPLGNQ